MSTHEDLGRHLEVKTSTDRAFGLVFAVVFLIVAAWPLLDEGSPRWWALGVSAALVLISLVAPGVLRPLNRLWTQFGLLLQKVVSPIVLGAILFLVVTPVGVLMRLTGKDPLRLRREPAARSYWIERSPPGPEPSTMSQQF